MTKGKVQVKIRVSPKVKAGMDLLYRSICELMSQEKYKNSKVVSYNEYWEIVFKKYLDANFEKLELAKDAQVGKPINLHDFDGWTVEDLSKLLLFCNPKDFFQWKVE